MPEAIHSVPVSVIIPCYRCSETVERALNSALNQTLPPTEILLIDDASGDDSIDLLYLLEKTHAPRVKVISQAKNGGPGLARNAGWEAATQPWLAFLDADDAWHPRKLEIQWSWLESHPDVVLCGHASQFSSGAIDFPVADAPDAIRLSPVRMLVSNRLPTRSVMLRRDLPFRFSTRRFSEDYLLWLEIMYAGYPAYRLEAPLAFCFRPEFSPGGMSGKLWLHEKGEISVLRALLKAGKIGWIVFALAVAWSYVKFLRRQWLMRRMR
jgi:glycosyltransferase involved in cell wall biosynthesis